MTIVFFCFCCFFFQIASTENISIHFDFLLFTVVEKPEGKKQPTDIEAGEKFGVSLIGCFSVCIPCGIAYPYMLNTERNN